MVDRITPQARSRIMAAIKSKDTQPELLLRKALFARGYRNYASGLLSSGRNGTNDFAHRAA